jgi:hypothetical protein
MIPEQVLLRLEPRKECTTRHLRETVARRLAIAPFGPSVAICLLAREHSLEYQNGGVASCTKATKMALQRHDYFIQTNLRRHRASIPSIFQDHDL